MCRFSNLILMLIIFVMFQLLCAKAQAWELKCGVYQLKGIIRLDGENHVLVTDEKSNNERRFVLKPSNQHFLYAGQYQVKARMTEPMTTGSGQVTVVSAEPTVIDTLNIQPASSVKLLETVNCVK